MTLSFKTEINGTNTYFIEKIWSGLLDAGLFSQYDWERFFYLYQDKFGKDWDCTINLSPKLHTIRQDKTNRWDKGKLIHPVIHNRTSQHFQFAPEIECKSTQIIEILPDKEYVKILKMFESSKQLTELEIKLLANNDGFDSIEEFWKYFNTDFEGKIIHWTNFRY